MPKFSAFISGIGSIPVISAPACGSCLPVCEPETEVGCQPQHMGAAIDNCGKAVCHPLLPHVKSQLGNACIPEENLCIALLQAECHRICGCDGDLSVLYSALHLASIAILHGTQIDGAIAASLSAVPTALPKDLRGWNLTLWGRMYLELLDGNSALGDAWMVF